MRTTPTLCDGRAKCVTASAFDWRQASDREMPLEANDEQGVTLMIRE